MRNSTHYHPDAFDSSAANCPELNPSASTMGLPEIRLDDPTSNDLSIIAAQLVEAAHKARIGDREAADAHIAHATALLRGKQSLAPSTPRLAAEARRGTTGGLLAWQRRRLIAHVDANLARRIPVGELAALFGLSTNHFTRTMKRSFGVSPGTYLRQRRIEVAQGLMLTTSESLSSIALTCGMYDQSHFTRSFHRLVGETPDSWRRTRREFTRRSTDQA
jgi:AraC family transcriptional regulator